MPRKAVSSYFGGFSLFANAGTSPFSSAPTPAKQSSAKKRLSQLCKKAKSAIKRKYTRAVSKLSFGSTQAQQTEPPRMTHRYYTPESATTAEGDKFTTNSPVSGQSSNTAVDQRRSGPESEELASETTSSNFKYDEPRYAGCRYSRHYTAIDGLFAGYLVTEDIYTTSHNEGKFWRTKGAYKARTEAVEWISNITGHSYADCKAVHLAVQYLDQFLCCYGRPIDTGLKPYALACLYLAKVITMDSSQVGICLPDSDKHMLQSGESKRAFQQVTKTLNWCVEMVEGDNGKKFVKTVDLPTAVNFLVLAFQSAAIELPGQFAKEQQQLERLHNRQQAVFAREFAIEPFAKACCLANILLRDQDSLLFRWSELAAACFFIAAQPGGINPGVFLKCTGYTLESVEPAIVYARAVCKVF
ncbi:hypothetical protein H4R99_003493 [Coemansia sp. RSA 1722]|nr:hypothetical protein H4R99_003493 [Coemansia sp. RSA 1722]KAJ2603465.1 hypothetical protein GGF39_000189 [Coemansia sp. RSA 1721]